MREANLLNQRVKIIDMNRKPHILLITPYYRPEIAASVQLMTSLTAGLMSKGAGVTVLTSASQRVASEEELGDAFKGETVIRVINPFVRKSGLIYKLLELLTFHFHILIRGIQVKGIDLIFISSTPPLIGITALLLSKAKRVPIVYNLQDIFPTSLAVAGILGRKGFLYKILESLETFVLTHVDRIITIDISFKNAVGFRAKHTPIIVIPNWIDLQSMYETNRFDNLFIKRTNNNKDCFIVLYAGNHGYLQNLTIILDAASILISHKDIQFVFVGDGNQKASIVTQAKSRTLSNCVFYPFQPYEILRDVYSSCDIGIIPMRTDASSCSIPSKTWNYLACSKPVIACVDEDSPFAEIIRNSKSGSVTPPSDPDLLAKVILHLKMDRALRIQMGANGREFVESNLSEVTAMNRYHKAIMNTLHTEGEKDIAIPKNHGYRPAKLEDIIEIVEIHEAAFPGFFMTLLGTRFLKYYYQFILNYKNSIFIVKESNSGVEGFVSGFINPAKFYAKLRQHKFSIGIKIIIRLITHPLYIPRLFGSYSQSRANKSESESVICELSSLAVNLNNLKQGVGRGLVTSFIEMAKGRCEAVELTTDADNNDHVNKLYLDLNFMLVESFQQSPKRRMNRYRRSITE